MKDSTVSPSKNQHPSAGVDYFSIFLCLFSLLLFSQNGLAARNVLKGTYFDSTRVIYSEGSRQGESIVLNNNSANNFLIQTYISEADAESGSLGKLTKDFIVTPPLARLGAHQSRALRILRTGGQFPADRESVFYLTVNLIPSESAPEPEDKGNQVKFVSALAIKVFYRPQALANEKDAVRDAALKLKASVSGGELVLSNTTPFWVTLRTLSIGGAPVSSAAMVRLIPPFGQQHWALPEGMKRDSIVPVMWTAVMESGFDTDPVLTTVALPSSTQRQR